MNIAIIGAGNVGRTLGKAWVKHGHRITFGVRNPEGDSVKALTDINAAFAVDSNDGAASDADIIILATPWDAAKSAIESCGNLKGKTIIDCTNPLKSDFSGLAVGFETSGAEQVASWATGARVFKAMNQIGWNRMDHPKFESGSPVMFVCGDVDGKTVVIELVEELGFDTIDAGELSIARLLEPYAMLWIHLALVQGIGRDSGFALLRN